MDKILSRATSFHFWRSGVDFIFCLHNALLVPSHLVHNALLAKPLGLNLLHYTKSAKSLFSKGNIIIAILRAIGDALNMMCHFYALNVLPLGDVMMIAAVRVISASATCNSLYYLLFTLSS